MQPIPPSDRNVSPRSKNSARIVVYEEGPYLVRGGFDLVGPEGQALSDRPIVALCGCGRSKTAPLCDGSHKLGRTRRRSTRLGEST